MPDSKRFELIIDGKRKCTKCKEIKDITESFRWNKAYECFSGKCKPCENEIRRSKYIKKERVPVIKFKKCNRCEEIKQINPENFGTNGKNYSNMCRECTLINSRDKREKRRHIGYYPDNKIKVCNICKEEKTIKDFSFSKKYNFYSYCCKQCDVKRKLDRIKDKSPEEKEELRKYNREWHYRNRPVSLLNVYRKFDFKRNLTCDLTAEYIKDSLEKPCSYCAYESTGLDRLNNTEGHTIENTVPCCWECNTAKMNNFNYDEMLIIGKAIAEVKQQRLN